MSKTEIEVGSGNFDLLEILLLGPDAWNHWWQTALFRSGRKRVYGWTLIWLYCPTSHLGRMNPPI